MDFACQHCAGTLRIDDRRAGLTIQCPLCNGINVAPDAPPVSAAPAPSPRGPIVDRCFVCGTGLAEGDVLRREVRTSSARGSLAWGGFKTEHFERKSVCRACAARLDGPPKQPTPWWVVALVILLLLVLACIGIVSSSKDKETKPPPASQRQ